MQAHGLHSRSESQCKDGLWVMMYPCRFITCKACTALAGMLLMVENADVWAWCGEVVVRGGGW